jgi:hypothetical protein
MMSITMPIYDEKKATQVAALLLKQSNNKMNFLRFMKIMYNIERESLRRWSYPVTNSSICSMNKGQVLSETYDKTKNNTSKTKSYWDSYIETTGSRDTITLKKNCSTEKLCEAEIELIQEIYQRDKDKSVEELVNEHHHYPEYIYPGNSSISTDYEKLLKALGKTNKQILAFKKDMQGVAYLEEIAK